MPKTPAREVVDVRLAAVGLPPFAEYAPPLRADGHSFGRIAIKIGQATDYWLTGETVRSWIQAEGLDPTAEPINV